MSPNENVQFSVPLPPTDEDSSLDQKSSKHGGHTSPRYSLETSRDNIILNRANSVVTIRDTPESETTPSDDVEESLSKTVNCWNTFKERASNSKLSRSISAAIERVRNHPLCPSRQKVMRFIAIVLVMLLFFGTGTRLGPGEAWTRLCVVAIVAQAAGMLVHSMTALPPLLGMLLAGVVARYFDFIDTGPENNTEIHIVRAAALVVLMIRTGFRLDPQRVRSLSALLLGLATLPGLAECAAVTVLSHFLIGLPVTWALQLGLVLAAACPSVLRPSFFRMGGGERVDGILLAAAGINDLVAISVFGLDISVIFSHDKMSSQLLHRPIGVFGGIFVGVVYGLIARYIPEKNDPQVASLRCAMLVSLGLLAIFGSEYIGLIGGGPIACMVAAMVSNYGWRRQGWTRKYNPVATSFDIFWRVMQPFMFALIGAEVQVDSLDRYSCTIGIGILCVAWALRMCVSLLVTCRGNMNFKEKLFISLAWLPKADVQAALSPFALDLARRRFDDDLKRPATICLMLVLLAVILTAPLNAALVGKRGLAPYLLGKSTPQQTQPQHNQANSTAAESDTVSAS